MDYTYEILKLEELDELFSLLKCVFKRDYQYVVNKTNWAFNNKHSCVFVAKHKGKIVASRGGFEWPLSFNGNDIKAIQFLNTGVHPEHRRRGLFTKLNKEYLKYAEENDIDYIFNVSVKISRLGYEKLGWNYLKGFHRLTLFNKPFKFAKSIQDKTISHKLKLQNLRRFELISNDFLEAREKQFKEVVNTTYTKDFLFWRLNNTEEDYRVFKNSEAYVIYKIIETNKIKSLILGEFFLMKNSRKLFSSTIKEIIKLENPDITYTYISRHHPYFSYYLFNLFTPNPFNFNLNFGTRNISLGEDLSKKKWAMSYLDIDTF